MKSTFSECPTIPKGYGKGRYYCMCHVATSYLNVEWKGKNKNKT